MGRLHKTRSGVQQTQRKSFREDFRRSSASIQITYLKLCSHNEETEQNSRTFAASSNPSPSPSSTLPSQVGKATARRYVARTSHTSQRPYAQPASPGRAPQTTGKRTKHSPTHLSRYAKGFTGHTHRNRTNVANAIGCCSRKVEHGWYRE